MNRTITMNLSGIIFHIEEDAYERLNTYLSTIKGYFNATEGREEIMGDIESRIAEMLQEKVSKAKQAVLLADIESVIAVMGKPEDFASDADQQQEKSTNQDTKYSEGRYTKRLFRDPDDKVLGGVCSGIANYFDLDPVWIRGAFAISFFAFGSGVLLYFILWLIMPVAKTTAEKLQMRGEKVDINNIGKAVNEEFSDLKNRVNRFGKEMGSPESREKFRRTTHSAGLAISATLAGVFSIVGKVFSMIFLLIGISLLTALLAFIFGKSSFMLFDSSASSTGLSVYQIAADVLPAGMSSELITATLLLFAGIPLLFIIYSSVKFLFNIRQQNKIVNYVASVLWLIGIALLVYTGVAIGNEFSTEASVKKTVAIIQPTGKQLYLDINPASQQDDEPFTRSNYSNKRGRNGITLDDWTLLSKVDDHYRLGYPRLDIVPSETDSFQLIVLQLSSGADKKEATTFARNISYETLQKDSSLLFNSYFDIAPADKFRGQELKIILKVPVNKSIHLSKHMAKIIFDIDNTTNTLDREMVNRTWKMTSEGLECIDCNGREASL